MKQEAPFWGPDYANPDVPVKPPRAPRRKPGEVGYYRGALVALAAMHAWDGSGGVAYKEVLAMFDLNELLYVARREGQMKWSGLSEYMRRRACHEEDTSRDA